MKDRIAFAFILAILLGACVPQPGGASTPMVITAEVGTAIAEPVDPFATDSPFPTPEPPTAIPTLPSASLSPTELKYKVLDQFPDFFFCDPDFYPIAREDELVLALQRFPELQADQEEFQVILTRTGLGGRADFTDDEKLLIYREHKRLAAIYFEVVNDVYKFQIQTGLEGQEGSQIIGTIDGRGAIDVQERNASFPSCPICLTAGTLIDAPGGPVSVENVRVGSQVWTMNAAGERVVGVVLQTGSVRAPATHHILHLTLSDGREVWASAGHPTADGRVLAELKVGDILDGSEVVQVESLPYDGLFTYDLLIAGGTSYYWANGILLGSTLHRAGDIRHMTHLAR